MVEINAIEVNETQRRRPLCEAIEERGLLAEELANIPKRSVPQENISDNDNPTFIELLSAGPELCKHVEKAKDFLDKVRTGYQKDPLFSKIILEKESHASFRENNGLIYSRNRRGHEVLCIPRVVTKDYSLMALVIEQAHTILGHLGAQKTADYIRRWYWWPRITFEVEKYCDTCGVCQANKTSTQRPVGLLHPLPIPNQLGDQ